MAIITIRRCVSGANVGEVEKIEGEINCSMTKLLGKTSWGNNAFIRRKPNWEDGTRTTIWDMYDLNIAKESMEKYGHKVIILDPEEK